jgi:hypothetical protein
MTMASAKEIERHLDGLSREQRVAEVLAVKGRGVKYLYDTAKGAAPVTLDEFVPPSTSGTLIYEGRNSLPLFSKFQKRFLRIEGGTVIGYNHQTWSFFTGPGYFFTREPASEGDFAGELLFDYTEPVDRTPEGWPRFKRNDRGLSKLVYGGMNDFCRRVAQGVIVGKAYRNGVDQDAFFTLTLP